MVLKKEIQFVLFPLLLLCSAFAVSQDKTIILGGKEGWPELSVSDNIVSGKGRFGYEAKVLSTNEKKADGGTDLLLNFEDKAMSDAALKYSIVSNGLVLSPKSAMGKTAGLSYGKSGLVLKGSKDSIFGTSGYKGSMSIGFWLYPSLAESGEIVFSWRSSRNSQVYSTYQTITASFFNGKMEWRFTNVFIDQKDSEKEILVTSRSSIIPNVWAHHLLVYNDEDGSIEYYINGSIEAVVYATNSLSAGSDALRLFLGVPADISLCPKFSGLIDDFSISTRAETNPECLNSYCSTGGHLVSGPLDTGMYASVFKRLEAEVSLPAQTGVQFFIRSGDNFYEWSDSYPEWIPCTPGKELNGISGKYFQVKADVYSDGLFKKSPVITEIRLVYAEPPLPLAPYLVKAVSGDSYVDVSWSQSVENSTGGYFIYYGEKPGEYMGRTAVQGASPVNAGKVQSLRLTGLTNGKIYYFAVSAYASYDERIKSALSKEVSARPLKE